MVVETQSRLSVAFSHLSAIGDGRLSTKMADRNLHGRDEGWRATVPPDAVFFPQSADEAAEGVRVCATNGIPIIPFGAGTSLEGQIIPTQGGIAFDMTRMKAIISVHDEDFYCVVQPGITRNSLNHELRHTGIFFPIDPGADATLGGMASTRASGTNAVRYGTMREAVMGLEVVLASGDRVRTGGRTRKSAAGLDLTAIFVGAEGTLGLITELTIRLHPLPEATATAVASFPDLRSAVSTVLAIMQSGLTVGRIEFLDELYSEALARFENLKIPPAPLLLLEFSGSPDVVAAHSELAASLAREHNALEIHRASDPDARARLWRARHRAYYAILKLRPGSRAVITDVCVPMSHLVDAVVEARDDLKEHRLVGPILGHVGDGNFHSTILVAPDNAAEMDAAEAAHGRMVARALSCGGTCTGEHGIGLGKRRYLEEERGRAVDLMRSIKRTLDPHSIFNPGKML